MSACRRAAGKYTPGGVKAGGPRSAMFTDDRLRAVQPLLGLMRDVGGAHGGKTPAQVAINWTICKGALPIPGAPRPRRMRHALRRARVAASRCAAGLSRRSQSFWAKVSGRLSALSLLAQSGCSSPR